MGDIILKAGDIYMQNIIQAEVQNAQPNEDDIVIYNRVCKQMDIDSLQTATEVMRLIHLNQSIINFGG